MGRNSFDSHGHVSNPARFFREFYPDALTRRNLTFSGFGARTPARSASPNMTRPCSRKPLELYKTKSGDEIEAATLFSFTDKGGARLRCGWR